MLLLLYKEERKNALDMFFRRKKRAYRITSNKKRKTDIPYGIRRING